jgi:hypothetical protein
LDKYTYIDEHKYLINTHNGYTDSRGTYVEPLNVENYISIKHHLDTFIEKLVIRQDKGITPYNLRNCAYLEDFGKDKVVWLNMNRKWKYSFVEAGIYVEASLNFIASNEYAKFLVGVLSSKLHLWYFERTGRMHDRGGYMCKIDTISAFPVPVINAKNNILKIEIEKIIDQILAIKKTDPKSNIKNLEEKIDFLVYELYELSSEEIKIIDSTTKK